MSQVAQGLFVVCDGMGGTRAGEVASQIAAATILQELQRPGNATVADGRPQEGYRLQSYRLAAAVRESNRRIYTDGQQNPARAEMGTTVVGAWLEHDIASIAHVGDSRAYLWRDDYLETLTRDHTLQEALASEGLEAGSEELLEDPRDMLLRVVGGEPDVDVDLVEIPLRSGDYLVMCTDGLTRIVPDTMVSTSISRFRDPQRICHYLVDLAVQNGGTDDITVVVVEIVETGLP